MTNLSHKLSMKREKTAVTTYQLCEAAVTNTPKLNGLKQQKFLPHSSGGSSLQQRRQQGKVPLSTEEGPCLTSPNFCWLPAGTGVLGLWAHHLSCYPCHHMLWPL